MKKPPTIELVPWAITVSLCVLYTTKAGCDRLARGYAKAKARRQEATR